MRAARLELVNISKSFSKKSANDSVSLKVDVGSIHAVVGENGAGKSTLMNIIYGLLQPDEGSILWESKELSINSPIDARNLGIGIVMQHFSLFESMTVKENLYLHASLARSISMDELQSEAISVAKKFGFSVDLDLKVETLGVGEKQRIEILKCLLQEDLKLLILDEPTAVLAPSEVQALLASLKKLAESGCSILYVSHKLSEVKAIADSGSVLRSGRMVANFKPSELDEKEIASLMLGPVVRSKGQTAGEDKLETTEVLRLENVSGGKLVSGRYQVNSLSFSVCSGEILGIAGIAGNGQDVLLDILSGEVRPAVGDIYLDKQCVGQDGLASRYKKGMSAVAAERRERSVSLTHSLTENLYLKYRLKDSGFLVNWSTYESLTREIISEYDVVCSGEGDLANQLSGGNLQKFIMGRELQLQPRCFVCYQPTWGVDIRAADFVRNQIKTLARKGSAVVVISEDLDELFELSSSLAVIHKGTLSELKPIDSWEVSEIGRYMAGLDHGSDAA